MLEFPAKVNEMAILRAGQKFDPEGEGYDMRSALQYGLTSQIGDDGKPHWPTRVPGVGLILKGRKHKTWDLGRKADEDLGYQLIKKGSRYYSVR